MVVLKWKDNRGYTLVELIISMAILAIVGGAITLLMQSGSHSYSSTKAELDLQMESQTLMSQMSTMIMEANNVCYDPAKKVLILNQVELSKTALPMASGEVGKPKYQTNKTLKDMKLIKYDSASRKLYMQESNSDIWNVVSSGAISYSEDELFADYINAFDVEVKGNNVRVSFQMKSSNRTYKVDETTKVRNGMVVYP